MKRSILVILAAMTVVPAMAQQQEKRDVPPSIQRQYERRLADMTPFDTNRDRRLQVAELQAGVQTKFNAADLNRDGTLSPAEIEGAIAAFRTREAATYGSLIERRARDLGNRYRSADTDEDGQLTRAEYTAYFGARYAKFDRDGDGIITQQEYRLDVEELPGSYNREPKD